MRSDSIFLSIDDKHKVKVGEPNVPVPGAEQGHQVVFPDMSY